MNDNMTEAWDIDDPEDYMLYMDVERDLFFLIDSDEI